jgi:protein-S-isoprenylcysteine O-methyltransferase Ste14
MTVKKHQGHPHLTGEHRWGDTGQLILLFLFLSIWITDSFIFHYSTFLQEYVDAYIRIPVAIMVWVCGGYLSYNALREIFGTRRESPELITGGVYRIVRHPMYAGAVLFYLGSALITLSVASAAFWLVILAFYISIARFEEKILEKEFGKEYTDYKRKTRMLFPWL